MLILSIFFASARIHHAANEEATTSFLATHDRRLLPHDVSLVHARPTGGSLILSTRANSSELDVTFPSSATPTGKRAGSTRAGMVARTMTEVENPRAGSYLRGESVVVEIDGDNASRPLSHATRSTDIKNGDPHFGVPQTISDPPEIVFLVSSLNETRRFDTKSKVTLLLIEMVGLGTCGVDRCYMGQPCMGVCKCLTLGGMCGIGAVIDYIIVILNCLLKYSEIDSFCYQASFKHDDVETAFWVAIICLALKCSGGCGHARTRENAGGSTWPNLGGYNYESVPASGDLPDIAGNQRPPINASDLTSDYRPLPSEASDVPPVARPLPSKAAPAPTQSVEMPQTDPARRSRLEAELAAKLAAPLSPQNLEVQKAAARRPPLSKGAPPPAQDSEIQEVVMSKVSRDAVSLPHLRVPARFALLPSVGTWLVVAPDHHLEQVIALGTAWQEAHDFLPWSAVHSPPRVSGKYVHLPSVGTWLYHRHV